MAKEANSLLGKFWTWMKSGETRRSPNGLVMWSSDCKHYETYAVPGADQGKKNSGDQQQQTKKVSWSAWLSIWSSQIEFFLRKVFCLESTISKVFEPATLLHTVSVVFYPMQCMAHPDYRRTPERTAK